MQINIDSGIPKKRNSLQISGRQLDSEWRKHALIFYDKKFNKFGNFLILLLLLKQLTAIKGFKEIVKPIFSSHIQMVSSVATHSSSYANHMCVLNMWALKLRGVFKPKIQSQVTASIVLIPAFIPKTGEPTVLRAFMSVNTILKRDADQ